MEKQAENDQIAYELDTANYAEGEYQIKAVAKDRAGNTNEELCFRTYTIDHTGISKIMLEEPVVGSTAVKLTWKDVTEEDFGWFRVEKLENGEFIKVEDMLCAGKSG